MLKLRLCFRIKTSLLAWLTVKNFEAKVDRLPDRSELNPNVKENFVIEHYSK
nr:hypothetical protein [Mycoplasmopsis bovis]